MGLFDKYKTVSDPWSLDYERQAVQNALPSFSSWQGTPQQTPSDPNGQPIFPNQPVGQQTPVGQQVILDPNKKDQWNSGFHNAPQGKSIWSSIAEMFNPDPKPQAAETPKEKSNSPFDNFGKLGNGTAK